MATVIDAFVVTLGLDPSGFRKGRQDTKAQSDGIKSDVDKLEKDIIAIRKRSTAAQQAEASKQKAMADEAAALTKNVTAQNAVATNNRLKQIKTESKASADAAKAEQSGYRNQLSTLRPVLAEKRKALKDARDDERKGINDNAKVQKEQVERQQTLNGAFGQTKDKIIEMFAAFTAGAGLTEFFHNTVATDAAVGRLAENLNMSVQSVSRWQGALKSVGGTAADADQLLQGLASSFADYRLRGDVSKVAPLSRLGVQVSDLADPQAAALKIADGLKAYRAKYGEVLAASLGAQIGLNQNAYNLLKNGSGAVQGALARQSPINDDDVAKAKALQDQLNTLDGAATSLGRNILAVLAPALTQGIGLIQRLADVAKNNMPVVTAAFIGLAIAAAALAVPLLIDLAPVVGMALALGAVAGAIAYLVRDFQAFTGGAKAAFDWTPFVGPIREIQSALAEVGSTFMEMVKAIMGSGFGAFMVTSFRVIGDVIKDVLLAALRGVINDLHAIADLMHGITSLFKGDFGGALKSFGKAGADVFKDIAKPLNAGGSPAAGTLIGGSVGDRAAQVIKGYEGFISSAKWDRNAYRVGYGSDTITDPVTGKVTKVTASTRGVTREAAFADLRRRIDSEFLPRVRAQVGASWDKLSDGAKASLISNAYNYGSLQPKVAAAARTGDGNKVAAAIAAQSGQNGGVNAGRRQSEALAAAMPTGAQLAANAYATNDNRSASTSTVQSEQHIGAVNVYTQATDAKGVAASIKPELARQSFVAQADSGLS